MDPNALAIPVAFILLSAVLCLLLIGSKWKWWQKLALIVIVPGFGLVVWSAIESYKGWPTASAPPERSLISGVLIREPDPSRNDPGAIYVWLVPTDGKTRPSINPLDYASPGGEPRAYKLPYSRPLHQGLERARGMLRAGKPVVLDLSGQGPPGGADGDGDDDQDADGGAGPGGPGLRGDPNRRDFQIYALPPPHPPEKRPE